MTTATKAELIAAADTLCATAFAQTRFPDNATARDALRDRVAPIFNTEATERRQWAADIVEQHAR